MMENVPEIEEMSWTVEELPEMAIFRRCLRVLSRGGEVGVNRDGIWTRDFEDIDYTDTDSGWELAFSRSGLGGKDKTADITRSMIPEQILAEVDDYDEARGCLDGLCFSRRGRRRRKEPAIRDERHGHSRRVSEVWRGHSMSQPGREASPKKTDQPKRELKVLRAAPYPMHTSEAMGRMARQSRRK